MGIDIDGVIECDLAKLNEALAKSDLEVQAVWHGHALEEPILRRRRWQKGKTREQTEVGAAHRIDGTDTDRVAENRLKDEAQGETL
jgi:hypothetical protein